ncbi:MAG: DHH family phosphoesterase [Cellulosilyticaceae bacterium]
MAKYQLMTHTDLDGVGCAILAKLYLKDVTVSFCSNNNINERVVTFLEGRGKETTHLLITDVSVNEDVARQLNEIKDLSIVLLDHHQTGTGLNQYKWATVSVETDGKLNCGTELFYNYIYEKFEPIQNVIHTEFVELVRLYDTWDWERQKVEQASWLNDLLQFQGLDRFLEEEGKKLEYGKIFTDEDLKIVEILKSTKESYIKRKMKSLIKFEVDHYQVGCVFGEQYISELGNAIADEYTDIDIVAIFTGKRVSLRSVKENINLGEWSKMNYGGGGHQLAAGMSVSKEKLNQIVDILFKKEI